MKYARKRAQSVNKHKDFFEVEEELLNEKCKEQTARIENTIELALCSKMKRVKAEKFNKILDLENISFEQLIKSFDVEKNRGMVFKAGQGAGKSGSFFFFSHDNKFIIKTLRYKEKQVLVNMLDAYINHIAHKT